MRILAIAAVASLALTPALAPAQSSTGSTNAKRPEPGPVAGRPLKDSEVPAGAIIIGGLVLLGGAVIGLLGSSSSNNNTNGANVPPAN
jgi:hypothetical protein